MANVLYLTHPTGVGFSHSDGDRANAHTDESDGVDNARFLRQWFAAYPEYLGNDFWLTGESYAGIYIPLTAEQVTTRALPPRTARRIKSLRPAGRRADRPGQRPSLSNHSLNMVCCARC